MGNVSQLVTNVKLGMIQVQPAQAAMMDGNLKVGSACYQGQATILGQLPQLQTVGSTTKRENA